MFKQKRARHWPPGHARPFIMYRSGLLPKGLALWRLLLVLFFFLRWLFLLLFLLLLFLCCGRRWRRTFSWPFRRPRSRSGCGTCRWLLIRSRHWAIRRTLCRCWASCWLFIWPRSWLFVWTCHRTIRWSVRRSIVWLCAGRTIIVSWWPRIRLRLRVGLSHLAIRWPIRWLRSILPIIGLSPLTVRRPVARLHGVRLSRNPTLTGSIPRLLVIRCARSVSRIVL